MTVRKTSSANATVMMMWLVTVKAYGIMPITLSTRMNMKIENTSGKNFMFILRSEEHTSELQSLTNLVCRLLLEKKNQFKRHYYNTEAHYNLKPRTDDRYYY